MGKPQKAEIWHAGAVGHGNGSGQVGGELSHVERGQGHVLSRPVAYPHHLDEVETLLNQRFRYQTDKLTSSLAQHALKARYYSKALFLQDRSCLVRGHAGSALPRARALPTPARSSCASRRSGSVFMKLMPLPRNTNL